MGRLVKIIVIAAVLLALCGGAAVYWLALTHDDPDAEKWTEVNRWFVDATEVSKLAFTHDAGDLRKYQIPQITGSGVALFDFDGDGRLDLYLLTNGGPDSASTNQLYRNMPDGTFADVTEGSGLGIAGFNMGVAIGDVNNDGLPDVLVTQVGGVKLFLNRGHGKFEDITEEAGLRNPQFAVSANFFDYDRDGWLDLVVVNYVAFDRSDQGTSLIAAQCNATDGAPDFCPPHRYAHTVTRLFRNLGAARQHGAPASRGVVSFEDVTVAAGLAKTPGPGLGVYCADFDGDGWPDIFVANDGQPNRLWMNQRNGTFVEEAFLRGIAVDATGKAQAGMGVAAGDIDGDGLLDIFVTHYYSERHTLWQQGPERGWFRDRTGPAGLLRSEWHGTGFGTLLRDFDNDGWLDLAIVNGRVLRPTATPNPALGLLEHYGDRNQLFRNLGRGKFEDVSRGNPPFCRTPNVARGLAAGDLDGDGGVDLVVTTIAGPARIYRNVAQDRGHWLLVRAYDPRLKRDAYGAEVTVRAGGRQQVHVVNPGDSYLSSSDPRIHFGLGKVSHVDAIRVRWPDGLTEVFAGGEVDRPVVLRRGEGAAEPATNEKR
jgi:hypothetical protein